VATSERSKLKAFAVDSSIFENGKLILLSEALGLSPRDFAYSITLLIALWSWVSNNCPDGVLTGSDCVVLSGYLRGKVCPPVGASQDLLMALCKTGFIDSRSDTGECSYVVHDWLSYQKNAAHRSSQRKYSSEKTSQKITGPSATYQQGISNVSVAHQQSVGDGGKAAVIAAVLDFTLTPCPATGSDESAFSRNKERVLDSKTSLESNQDLKQDSKIHPPVIPPSKKPTALSGGVESESSKSDFCRADTVPYSKLLLSPRLGQLCEQELAESNTVYREIDQYLVEAFSKAKMKAMGEIFPTVDIRRVCVSLLEYNIKRRKKFRKLPIALSKWCRMARDRRTPLLREGYARVVAAPPGSEVVFNIHPAPPSQIEMEAVCQKT
jgi:hypothetical protein